MNQPISLLKKVSNIFGIALILLGFIPVPVISQVSGVYANVETGVRKSAFVPDMAVSYNNLLGDLVSGEKDSTLALPDMRSGFISDSILACEGDDCTAAEIVQEEGDVPDDTPETESEPPQNEVAVDDNLSDQPASDDSRDEVPGNESGDESQDDDIDDDGFIDEPGDEALNEEPNEEIVDEEADDVIVSEDLVLEDVVSDTDLCIDDDSKISPGVCGCGVPDTDSDGDGLLDCEDEFPQDALNGMTPEVQNEISDEDSDLIEIDVQSEVIALAEAGGVLLDENDKLIPLSSEEALETLSSADPYFMDGGLKYCFVPTGETCSPTCDVCNESSTPVQNAIDAASAGTTIFMESGAEFTESIVINKAITLRADGNKAPTLKSSNGEFIVKIENTDNVSLFDLKFDGGGDSDVIGIWIVNSGDVLLQGNEIVDNAVGVQIDNTTNTNKVRIYKNNIESKTSGSVGIKVNAIGDEALSASLNTIQNDQYNVEDNSGKEDFDLYLNDWGYVDGDGNYQLCSIEGNTISDYNHFYNCAQLYEVLSSEIFLDGSDLPDVFGQGLEGNGGLCIAEKNENYAVKLDQPNSGTIKLNAGQKLAAVGIKSSDGCYYGQAPTVVGDSITVNGKDGNPCYQVTLTENNQGNLEYYYEKIGDGNGCQDISHMVGYYAAPKEEEKPEIEPLNINLVCLGEGQFSWRVANPNDETVDNVQVKVDGNVVYAGSVSANSEVGNTINVGIASPSIKMEVTWEGNGYAMTETDQCETEELSDLQLSLECIEEGQVYWKVSNPNDVAINDVIVKIDGTVVYQGAISAKGEISDIHINVNGSASVKMEVSWEGNGYAMKQTDACLGEGSIDLQLNMVCLGVGQLGWSVTNPNDFEVENVQVLIDNNLVFDGSLSAQATVGVGTSSDGPEKHTMVVTWEEEGYASLESEQVCENVYIPPSEDPPVSIFGEPLLLPVTGLNLASIAFPLRGAIIAGGMSILGLSYVISKRRK